MRLNSWDMANGGSGGRARQFPPEAPEAATLARPRAVAPGGGADIGVFGTTDARTSSRTDQNGSGRTHAAGTHAGDTGRQRRGKSGRLLALSAGGVLLVAVATIAVLDLGHVGDSPAPAQTTDSQPLGPGVLPQGPDAPTVTARSIGGQQVEFKWNYTGSASGDSFRVQVIGDSRKLATTKPDFVLSVTQGQRVCIQVQVISTHGVESPESSVSCWPKS
jgi:hypothetical protein